MDHPVVPLGSRHFSLRTMGLFSRLLASLRLLLHLKTPLEGSDAPSRTTGAPDQSVISKSWKIRYCLAALAIGSLPQQGLIMNYMTLSAPWVAITIECISLPLSRVDRTIRYNA